MGSADSAASPRSGPRTGAVKITPRSGVSPRAKTSLNPAPTAGLYGGGAEGYTDYPASGG